MLRDDTGLDGPSLHLSTTRLRPLVCAPSHLCILKQHSCGVSLAVSSTVMEDFFHQTVQTMYQRSEN